MGVGPLRSVLSGSSRSVVFLMAAGSILCVLWSAVALAVVTTSVVYGDECDINNPSGQFSELEMTVKMHDDIGLSIKGSMAKVPPEYPLPPPPCERY